MSLTDELGDGHIQFHGKMGQHWQTWQCVTVFDLSVVGERHLQAVSDLFFRELQSSTSATKRSANSNSEKIHGFESGV